MRSLASAHEAIAEIANLDPALVLYEWHTRDSSAAGFPRRIRAASTRSRQGMMVVAVSSQDEPEGFTHAEDVDAYLTKPYRIEAIEALLNRAQLRTRP